MDTQLHKSKKRELSWLSLVIAMMLLLPQGAFAQALSLTGVQTDVSCNGGTNGSATVTANAGTPPYTYSWAPSGGTAATATGLAAGSYTVTVTDAALVTDQLVFTITEPSALSLTPSSTDETPCNNSDNGTASVSVSGGTPGYTYSWSHGPTTSSVSGLTAGNYTVTVTDANSCTATQTYSITEPTQIVGAPSQTNVSCNGGSNGSATVIASGGGSPFYAYSWSPTGGTGSTASGLTAGNYTVTISNGLGCSGTQTFTITEPAPLSIVPSQTNVGCNGGATGSATATVSGGTGFYSYAWSPNGGTGSTASNLTAGSYTVLVTDFNFCTATQTYNITQPSALTLSSGGQTNVSCNGGANGTATVSVTGGTSPFTYAWAPNGGTGATGTGLSAGTYTVTVTDANTCQGTQTFTITEPTALAASSGGQTNVICNGAATGDATVSVTGGTTPYTYSWAPSGGTAATATGLTAGMYTVTVTDNNLCTTTQTFNITQSTAIATTGTQTSVSCFGGSDGTATVTPSGGLSPYTYSWAPSGGTAATATGLAAANYTVTVTDANLCSVTHTFAITEPAQLVASSGGTTSVSCNGGSDGTATVSVTGGTTAYSYSWAPSGGTGATGTGLSAGNYTVTVTDANLCSTTQTFNVTEPSAITTTGTQTNVSCNGGSDGSATVSASGGTGAFTYSWAPSGGTAATATSLAAGNYTVTVTDANLCTTTQTFNITEPTVLTASITASSNVSCNGGSDGSATVTASGGTSAYTYSWAPSGGTAATATGLAAATYTVTVTDANLCTTTQTVTITQPTTITTSGTQTSVSCNGGSDGTATVTPSGGTGIYTYSWAPSGGTSATATGLAAGSYTVTVTDANLCSTTHSFTITQPTAITTTGSQTNVSCNGGSDGTATLVASGGTPGYTYSWVPSGGTSATATGLTVGAYIVTVTDANGCTAIQTYNITQPTAITTSGSQTNVTCNGASNGTATVTASGGTGAFTYSWAPSGGTAATATSLAAGNYTVTVTDANLCTTTQTFNITEPTVLTASNGGTTNVSCNGGSNGSATVSVTGGTTPYSYSWAPSGGTAATATGLAAGTYTVTVVDANFCTTTQSFSITEPTTLSASGTQTDVSCFGGTNGTATVTAAGGTSPYTYSWAPTGGTGSTASGLAAGTYTVTVTDNNLCTTTQTYTITEPTLLVASSGGTSNVSCNGGNDGTATVTASGGTTAYTYSWAPSGGTAATATGLSAGVYTATVTDANSCTATQTFSITEPTILAASITASSNVSCNGGSNGSATVTATGGTTAYSYSWAPSGGTAATATGLAAGTYTVTVTDANLCTTTETVSITEPTVITSTGTQTNVSCNGGGNGTATVTPSGGTPSFTYSWAPFGGTSATATGLPAGSYTVTVTDANSCVHTHTFTITQPAVLAVTPSQTNVLCNGGNSGTATATVTGGTSPYTYFWTPSGQTTATATGLSAGSYTVAVLDVNSCATSQTYNITEPAALSSTGTQTNVTCNAGSDGTASVAVAGGTTPYTYSWAPTGGTAATASSLAAGNYTVTVTDANLCVHTRTFNITEPTAIVGTPSQTNVSCFGGSDGTATVVASGGSSSFFSYSWAPTGGTGSTAMNLTAGNYTVTITNSLLCTGTQTFTITQPTQLVASNGGQTNVLCNGALTGSATVSVTGGTTPYTYSWAPTGGTGATASSLAAGTYTATVTDANGCTATQTFNLTQPTDITTTGTSTNVSCFGGNNGTASVTASGGTGSYTYLWAPSGGTASTATGLMAGTYTVTVTDANSCTATHTYTITQPTVLATTGTQTGVSCYGGSNGTATVSVTGGVTPYTYSWAPSGGTAATATGLATGTYTVTVTDANLCTTTRTFAITQPAQLTTLGTQTNVSCNAGSNGSATVMVTGGVPGYTYSWAPSGGTAATASGLSAGNYTVTVTDLNACTITQTYNITEPAQLLTNGTSINVTCFGFGNGTASTAVTGGTAPYSYLWAPGGQTSASVSNLTPGTYTVTVTDANACTANQTFNITQPTLLTSTASQVDVLCNGNNTGSATITVTGGTLPYMYSWAPTGGTGATESNLTAGSYTATVTDGNGCVTSQTYTITEPTQLALTSSSSNLLCNGDFTGAASVSVSGGVTPYNYSWAPTGGNAASATGLAAGAYTVTVTDDNGCTLVQTFNITEPPVLATTASSTNVTCNGFANGTASVTATGGTLPYSYNWMPTGGNAATATNLVPGTYTVTVTDDNGCMSTQTYNITEPATLTATGGQTNVTCNGYGNGTATVFAAGGTTPYSYNWMPTGGSAATATGLTPGTYTATVTDANGCVVTQTYNITQPNALSFTSTTTAVNCNGNSNGSASISVTGGTAPFTYSWAPGGQTTAAVTGLSAGTYTATVTDNNGCSYSNTVTVTQPAALVALAANTSPACSGDSMAVIGTAYGGTAPYNYAWVGPVSANIPVISMGNVTTAAAGTYTLTVTDANGCVSTDVTTAVVNQTPTITTQPQPATACVGSSAGFSITAIGTGISYQWKANGVNISNTGVYSGANTNTLSISDVTGLDGTMYQVIVSGVCTPDTSISVMLTAPSFNSWTGSVDTAWSNASNWQCGIVPTINTDVIIPASAPKMPLVNIATATANSITINSGATLGFVGTGSQVEVRTDITNLGTFNASNGAVMLSGTSAQSIPGVTYGELELTGSSIKTSTGNLTVSGNLILTDGYLQLGTNNLTLSQSAVVTGGSAASFVITNGTGVVIRQGLGTTGNTGTAIFPVGALMGVYTPAAVQNAGTMDNFSVRVIEGVYTDYSNEVPVGGAMSNNTVDKTWFINEAVNGGSNATVSLSWPLTEELPGFNNSMCDVSHYNEDSLNWESDAFGPASGTVVLFTRSRAGVSTFSPFGLGTINGPLAHNAVTLTGIYNAYNKTVDLNWDKSNDPDVVTYSLERSENGITYTSVTSKEAGQEIYEHTDAEVASLKAKQLYYRLQVSTNDGSYVYTNTVKVDIASSVVTYGLTLYPNPVSGSEVFVSISDDALATDMDIVVTDVLGKEVRKYHYDAGTYNPNMISVNVDDLAQGMYTLRVKQAGSMIQTVKFTRK